MQAYSSDLLVKTRSNISVCPPYTTSLRDAAPRRARKNIRDLSFAVSLRSPSSIPRKGHLCALPWLFACCLPDPTLLTIRLYCCCRYSRKSAGLVPSSLATLHPSRRPILDDCLQIGTNQFFACTLFPQIIIMHSKLTALNFARKITHN